MANFQTAEIKVLEIGPNEWQRFKDLRIRSLNTNPEAFGGDFTATKQMSGSEWQAKLTQLNVLVATFNSDTVNSETVNSADVGIMTVENLDGDFGTTCWIGGCWVDPNFRGRGVLSAMFEYLDKNAGNRNWQKQGLGVWEDNTSAIAAYAALGFRKIGKPKPSTSKPGKFYQRMIRESSQF